MQLPHGIMVIPGLCGVALEGNFGAGLFLSAYFVASGLDFASLLVRGLQLGRCLAVIIGGGSCTLPVIREGVLFGLIVVLFAVALAQIINSGRAFDIIADRNLSRDWAKYNQLKNDSGEGPSPPSTELSLPPEATEVTGGETEEGVPEFEETTGKQLRQRPAHVKYAQLRNRR